MASITLIFAVTLAVILLVSFREIRERNQTTLEHYVASYTLKQTTSTNKSQSLNDTVPKEDKTDLQLATFYAVALSEKIPNKNSNNLYKYSLHEYGYNFKQFLLEI